MVEHVEWLSYSQEDLFQRQMLPRTKLVLRSHSKHWAALTVLKLLLLHLNASKVSDFDEYHDHSTRNSWEEQQYMCRLLLSLPLPTPNTDAMIAMLVRFGNRVAFNPELGGVRDVASAIISHEQIQ